MRTVTGEDKIAVLLTSLPATAAEAILQRLGAQRGGRLRGLMNQTKTPPPPELLDHVLRELEQSLLLPARRGPRAMLRLAPGTLPHESDSPDQTADQPNDSTGPVQGQAGEPQLGDPVAELRKIDVDRLAPALQGEHPRTVATVLSCLDVDKAGETLKRLPAETRRDVFLRLGQPAGGGSDLVQRIVRAVLHKSQLVAASPGAASGQDKAKLMADVLKAMERTDRMDLLGVLEAQDAELAAAVREKLYVFEDLLVIEDRSVQKLLAEIDSKTLALALKDASEAITEKVMKNLSKRARETVAEEISFLGSIPPAQIEQARKAVVEVIQRLDQAGELMMTR